MNVGFGAERTATHHGGHRVCLPRLNLDPGHKHEGRGEDGEHSPYQGCSCNDSRRARASTLLQPGAAEEAAHRRENPDRRHRVEEPDRVEPRVGIRLCRHEDERRAGHRNHGEDHEGGHCGRQPPGRQTRHDVRFPSGSGYLRFGCHRGHVPTLAAQRSTFRGGPPESFVIKAPSGVLLGQPRWRR
jgi:hypothetical protein